jgi:hypothetical protein
MKNILMVITLLWFLSGAHGQTFKGTVYDRATDSTLCCAIVYISGTSVGTYCDIHGNFTLDLSQNNTMPVTISLLGYYSVTIPEHSSNKMYNIYLSPKTKELNEVVVKAKKGQHWDDYLRIFKREFLGESGNALQCDILNEKDLRFTYNSDSCILRAYSIKPLLIQNNSLGYSINYYLDKFKFSRKSDENRVLTETFVMMGNYIFKDNLSNLSEAEQNIIKERRKSAYLGSRMHFFRLLYQEKLIQTGKNHFLLPEDSSNTKGYIISSKKTNDSDSLVIRKDSISSYLKKEDEINVRFRMKSSKIYIQMDSVYFEKNGYFDPVEITFSGDMSKKRIGDLLPFEYSPK